MVVQCSAENGRNGVADVNNEPDIFMFFGANIAFVFLGSELLKFSNTLAILFQNTSVKVSLILKVFEL